MLLLRLASGHLLLLLVVFANANQDFEDFVPANSMHIEHHGSSDLALRNSKNFTSENATRPAPTISSSTVQPPIITSGVGSANSSEALEVTPLVETDNPTTTPESSETTLAPSTNSRSIVPNRAVTPSANASSSAATSTPESTTSTMSSAPAETMKLEQATEVKPKSSSGTVALIMAISFAITVIIVYFGLLVWRRYLEYHYGNRELLVNDLEFDTNDLRHFEL